MASEGPPGFHHALLRHRQWVSLLIGGLGSNLGGLFHGISHVVVMFGFGNSEAGWGARGSVVWWPGRCRPVVA